MINFNPQSPGLGSEALDTAHEELYESYNNLLEERYVVNALYTMATSSQIDSDKAGDSLQMEMPRVADFISRVETANQSYLELLDKQKNTPEIKQAQKHAKVMMDNIGKPARKLYDKGNRLLNTINPVKGPTLVQKGKLAKAALDYKLLQKWISDAAKKVPTVQPGQDHIDKAQMRITFFSS